MDLLLSNITLIAVIAILAILAFYRGKGLLFSIIISFYPALVIYKAFPYTERFIFFKDTAQQIYLSHLLVFFVFFLVIYFAVRRLTHGDGTAPGIGGAIDAILLSLGVTLLTLVLTFHILPSRDIYNLSAKLENFFTSDMGYFVGVTAPMALVYYMSRKTFY